MKVILFACFCFLMNPLFAGPDVETGSSSGADHFYGRVTAVNSNGNRPGVSFTAVNDQGQIKMFYISSLKDLDLNDRVELTYKASEKFPLEVTRIRFLNPQK
ncbi:MAG: hypothetical protein V4507_02140 [Verrucomicrobiota bacterium]